MNYDTKKGRTINTLLFFGAAIVYLIITGAIVRGFGLENAGVLRFLLTIPQEIIFIIGGIKLFKSAEQAIGKGIGVVFVLIAVAEFIISLRVNLGLF